MKIILKLEILKAYIKFYAGTVNVINHWKIFDCFCFFHVKMLHDKVAF